MKLKIKIDIDNVLNAILKIMGIAFMFILFDMILKGDITFWGY